MSVFYSDLSGFSMSIHQVFVISRAGSEIYNWEAKVDVAEVQRTFTYPLSVVLEEIDSKAVVVFGAKDGVKLRYYVTAVNGFPVEGKSGPRFTIGDEEHHVLTYLDDEDNYPVELKFRAPSVSANEKIILSSMFHSLSTIAVQLSPAAKSSGIEVLETSQFRLSCLQSRTGVKFVVVTSSTATVPVEGLLNKLYELYADFALKNPFYAIDQPIRCQKFDEGLRTVLEKIEKNNGSIVI